MPPQERRGDDGRKAGTPPPRSLGAAAVKAARALYSRPEAALAAAATILAAWTVATTLAVVRAGYCPLPAWDEWDRWRTYLADHYSLRWFFLQHMEHRIAAPRVLFAIDHLLFGARGRFLLACTLGLYVLLAGILYRLSLRVSAQDRSDRLVLAAVIVSLVFSAQQYINFIWGFQVQFPLMCCSALGSLTALLRAHREKQKALRWVATSIALAATATYSMSNGVLVWPLLLLEAAWLRLDRRWVVAILAGAVLIELSFFHGWQGVHCVAGGGCLAGSPVNPLASWTQLRREAVFFLAHLGSPLDALLSRSGSASWEVIGASVIGGLLLLTSLVGYALVWRWRNPASGAQAVLMHASLFLIASSSLIAIGRSDFLPVSAAFTSRYLTPAYLLWACTLIAAWPVLRRLQRQALYGAICLVLFGGIAVHQLRSLREAQERTLGLRWGETAVVDAVLDPDAWAYVSPNPDAAAAAVDYLKQNRLAIFTEEWTHWPGIRLDGRFSLDSMKNACKGAIDPATPVSSRLQPGWRISGWAWDAKASGPPQFVILGDGSGRVAGVALTDLPRRGPTAVSQKYAALSWGGYVRGKPGAITAYALESDGRTLCIIGTRSLPAQ